MIRQSALSREIHFETSKILNIRGITSDSVSTLGTVKFLINCEELSNNHEFHVVPDQFDIPIGKDFCKLYRCTICYDSMKFKITTHLGNVSVDLKHGIEDDEIILPPRSEIFRSFKMKSSVFPVVIKSKFICDGVFSANTITYQ